MTNKRNGIDIIFLMYKLFLLSILIYVQGTNPTEVEKYEYDDSEIKLFIEKVEVGALGTMILTNFNKREMILVCANTKGYGVDNPPMIQFKNYFNIHAADFYIDDDEKCTDLKEFLIRTFEGIDANHPLEITLDRRSMMVSYIRYPDIDPLLQYHEFEVDEEIAPNLYSY